jgi:hypothetical protein
VTLAEHQQKERARRARMLDRTMLIEGDEANERGAKFKRAGKLGQENEQAIQVPIPPPPAIFLPSIFLPDHNRSMTQRHLYLPPIPPPESWAGRHIGA